MKRLTPWLFSLLILTGCNNLSSIPYRPERTPQTWLSIQPFVKIAIGAREIVIIQPSSTIFVYLLGIIAVGAGVHFLRIRQEERSRLWWGVALILWGLGALSAGTSYQAFSYEIKCAGRDLCSWTSWWEVIYLLLSVGSIDAMAMAVAYSSTTGTWRKVLIGYGSINIAGYMVTALIGAFALIPFLISFELLLIVSAPSIILFLIINGWRALKVKQDLDRALSITWVWLGIVIGAYFSYLSLGFTDQFWTQGIWFSENDVLHIGLITWMVYISAYVAKRVKDAAL